MHPKTPKPYLLIAVLLAQSCSTSYSTYVNPLEGNSNHYREIPLQSDSIKTATYASAALTIGGQNDLNDLLFAFHGSVHRSYNFRNIQAYYGAGLALGSYRLNQNQNNFTIGQRPAVSPKFFASYGANGGMNLVVDFGNFEWRAIGVEGSLFNEAGAYLNYRRKISDSNISVLETNSLVKSIGATTEFLWKRRSGIVFGYKMALGGFFIPNSRFKGVENYDKPLNFSNTVHATKGRLTGFWQINFGSYNNTFQMGACYQIGKARKS